MLDKNNMTASEIYTFIRYDYAKDRDEAVKVIENYGLRKQREFMNNLKEEILGYSAEITEKIKRMNDQLDKLLNSVLEARN